MPACPETSERIDITWLESRKVYIEKHYSKNRQDPALLIRKAALSPFSVPIYLYDNCSLLRIDP